METTTVTNKRSDSLLDFLQLHDFEVEVIEENVCRVVRNDELPVYVYSDSDTLHFEVDLGNVSSIASLELYTTLLDANTEIQPVCFALNSTNPEDPRLIITESRVTADLSSEEVLSVFDALELAADKAEVILASFLKNAQS